MSKIGKKPIVIEPDIDVCLNKEIVHVAGEKGQLDIKIPQGVSLERKGNYLFVKGESKRMNLQGLTRSLIQNAINGVKKLWRKELEMVGVGFRAKVEGNELILNLGFSHPVKITAPQGINFQVKENQIIVEGVDKYLVGEVAASIRRVKPPEPYKGKGIRYRGEVVRRKLGKAVKAVGGISGGLGAK